MPPSTMTGLASRLSRSQGLGKTTKGGLGDILNAPPREAAQWNFTTAPTHLELTTTFAPQRRKSFSLLCFLCVFPVRDAVLQVSVLATYENRH